MTMHFEIFVETTCCGRPRALSQAVLSVRQIGLVIWATYRCKDSEACEGLEREQVEAFNEPYWKVLSS